MVMQTVGLGCSNLDQILGILAVCIPTSLQTLWKSIEKIIGTAQCAVTNVLVNRNLHKEAQVVTSKIARLIVVILPLMSAMTWVGTCDLPETSTIPYPVRA